MPKLTQFQTVHLFVGGIVQQLFAVNKEASVNCTVNASLPDDSRVAGL